MAHPRRCLVRKTSHQKKNTVVARRLSQGNPAPSTCRRSTSMPSPGNGPKPKRAGNRTRQQRKPCSRIGAGPLYHEGEA